MDKQFYANQKLGTEYLWYTKKKIGVSFLQCNDHKSQHTGRFGLYENKQKN